jgi:hypothetical protein
VHGRPLRCLLERVWRKVYFDCSPALYSSLFIDLLEYFEVVCEKKRARVLML